MNRFTLKPLVLATLLALSVSACDSIPFVDTSSDYKAAGRSRPLEVPPDLTSISSNDTYAVPGSTTYSNYSQGQTEQVDEQVKVLANPDNVRLERAGAQRWLVVQAPPEKIWPVVREFWADLGFSVRVENPQTGVMETEWVDPSTLTKDDKGNYLDKFQGWLDKLNTLQNRQKFRTRLDNGTETGTTEIYMSHRSVSEVPDDNKERVVTSAGVVELGYKRSKKEEARADAEDIDAELLRRLMVKLGVEEKKSRTIITTSNTEVRAKLNQNSDGSVALAVNDSFDRAWRRVGLALDRVGFVVEDRDRSSGIFYVRYSDVDIDDTPQKKKGLIDSLKFWGDDKDDEAKKEAAAKPAEDKGITDKLKFWGSDKDKAKQEAERQYRVKVEDDASGSKVTVTDKDGVPSKSASAKRIINLLFEQLK
ncbi:outer membrane protein assembly factor BamC [Methylovorus menthalis]|uniref:outer membrane protein assembly factor BamC n=1 Tax=Methylovorus menthalis TaxID=1002227 RepID=UPI001E4A5C29|nr:outer membrane protein assembly factor BamC [Methylovorus menthalis]MCB4811379.1 outer membrane protein assembly factor BamC [Methylovorus menthalis]